MSDVKEYGEYMQKMSDVMRDYCKKLESERLIVGGLEAVLLNMFLEGFRLGVDREKLEKDASVFFFVALTTVSKLASCVPDYVFQDINRKMEES